MSGHYHFEMFDGTCINEGVMHLAVEKAKANGSGLYLYGWVSTWGSGLLEKFTQQELAVLDIHFPEKRHIGPNDGESFEKRPIPPHYYREDHPFMKGHPDVDPDDDN